MDLDNIMLSGMSQWKRNIIWFHSYVESNEQTELTTQRQTQTEQVDSYDGVGVEELSRKEKGLMDMDNSVVIAGGSKGSKW